MKLPGVLSFQRGIVVGDGTMYSKMPDGSLIPIPVFRHGIRGTQNVAKEKDSADGTTANTKGRDVSQIQTTDSAKTHPDSIALVLKFDMKAIDLKQLLFACAPAKGEKSEIVQTFGASVQQFLVSQLENGSAKELALRYVRNLTNARFLWRNRIIAQHIQVAVSIGDRHFEFNNCQNRPLNDFSNFSDEENALADVLVEGMQGKRDAFLNVVTTVDLGLRGSIEVFPSQNYLSDKEDGFARSLYSVAGRNLGESKKGYEIIGHAAIRDQKIGNAIRTIDTWYKGFDEFELAIPVEPNGANLSTKKFHREGTQTAFKLLTKLDELKDKSNDSMFMLACLIRGGVYSEGG